MVELKGCPFCGGKAAFDRHHGSYGYYPRKLRIKCATKGCFGQTGFFDHGERDYDETPVAEGKAIAAWNTRPPADEALATLQARGDRLAELLQRYRNETPAGHSPHMICHKADEALTEWRKGC